MEISDWKNEFRNWKKQMRVNNIFASIPERIPEEMFEDLLKTDHIRIERILSQGQTSPAEGWYDQAEHEWVLVLEGSGILQFEDGKEITLNKGDFYHIAPHVRHRVGWTDPDRVTVWLAVFFNG
jgi:cupin 2 domain-containing protein